MKQVPETKGVTLEEMDEVFGDKAGTSKEDLARQMEISKRIGLDAYGGGADRASEEEKAGSGEEHIEKSSNEKA
jgi:hypothetical protein